DDMNQSHPGERPKGGDKNAYAQKLKLRHCASCDHIIIKQVQDREHDDQDAYGRKDEKGFALFSAPPSQPERDCDECEEMHAHPKGIYRGFENEMSRLAKINVSKRKRLPDQTSLQHLCYFPQGQRCG